MICPSCLGTRVDCAFCLQGLTSLPVVPHLPADSPQLKDFGAVRAPLHASGLDSLVRCPWNIVMEYLFGRNDESGPAADTGSACHAAVAAWHLLGKDAAAAVEAMALKAGKFPLADLDEAAALFLLYANDKRNREADVVAVEREISFLLPACSEDPTGEAVHVIGQLDQVRRVNGKLLVYDIKTSKRPGRELMDAHQYQVAAYCLGASWLFGEPVGPGALICPRRYPGEAYFPYQWTFDDARFVLWGVRRIVAAVRAGEVWNLGGMHCRYCPAGSTDNCVPKLREVVDPRTMRISTARFEANTSTFPVDTAPPDVDPMDEWFKALGGEQ